MKIACPYCSQHYDVKLEYLGIEINCVTCKKEFMIRREFCIDSVIPDIPRSVHIPTKNPKE